jgi:hypothetical protein
MRFLMIYTPDEAVMKRHEAGAPPTPQEMATMGKLMADWTKAGVLLSAEGCLPSSKGAKVKKSGKDIKVTDGPFTEAKELVGGYWLIDVKSKEEAVEWASRAPINEGDVIEVRQVFEMEDHGPEVQAAWNEQAHP